MAGTKSTEERERFLFPVELTSSKTLRFVEGASNKTATVAAGKYWLHRSTSSDYPGLYKALEDAMNAASTEDYTVRSTTPTGSDALLGAGLAIEQTSAGAAWTIDWDNSTLDPRLLGFPAGSSGTVAALNFTIRSPMTRWGDWIPWRNATRKDRDVERWVSASSRDVGSDAFEQVDYGLRETRSFEYRWNPAALAIEIVDPVYQEVAGLDYDEAHASFETLWTEGFSKREDVLCVYEAGDQDLELTTHEWEALVLQDPDPTRGLRACLSRRPGAERYNLAFTCAIRGGVGGYGY